MERELASRIFPFSTTLLSRLQDCNRVAEVNYKVGQTVRVS